LGEPLAGGDVLEQDDSLAAIEYDLVITACDRLTPPLVVDPPTFEDSLDHDVTDRARSILRIALDGDGVGDVYGSKSISA
jgi:hypothetical protein